MFQPIIGTAVRGDPDAVLIVEFAEEDQAENIRRLKQLGELMADLGFGWDHPKRKWGGVVEITEPSLQTGIAEFRAAGLNVMMSMKQEGKPVSFVEDCAVPLPQSGRLYRAAQRHFCQTRHPRHHVCARLGRLFARQACAQPETGKGRQGDARHRRRNLCGGARIQGVAFRRTRRRHRAVGIPRGDVRPAHHRRLQAVKHRFDPGHVLNPGKIVDAPKMDDRSLFSLPAGLPRR